MSYSDYQHTSFGFHLEDGNLNFINFLHRGEFGQTFSLEFDMPKNIRQGHGTVINRYECENYGKTCTTSSSMKTHLSTIHSLQMDIGDIEAMN